MVLQPGGTSVVPKKSNSGVVLDTQPWAVVLLGGNVRTVYKADQTCETSDLQLALGFSAGTVRFC